MTTIKAHKKLAAEMEKELMAKFDFPLNTAANGILRDVLVPIEVKGEWRGGYCSAHEDGQFRVVNQEWAEDAKVFRKHSKGAAAVAADAEEEEQEEDEDELVAEYCSERGGCALSPLAWPAGPTAARL